MNRTAADDSATYADVQPGRRVFVRVGLNRHTETAQEQILYVLEALVPTPNGKDVESSLIFQGTWWGSREQEQTLRAWLDECLLSADEGYRLEVGTARARGMGHVILRLTSVQADPGAAQKLALRLEQFQPKSHGQLIDPSHIYAALTLRSPLVAVDARGLPAERITVDLLRAYHANVPSSLEVLAGYSVLERETKTGWSAAWGLPKPVTTVIAAGSVIALRVLAAEREQLLDYLAVLAGEGLGEHRSEGFGEVLACDPFHVVFDEG